MESLTVFDYITWGHVDFCKFEVCYHDSSLNLWKQILDLLFFINRFIQGSMRFISSKRKRTDNILKKLVTYSQLWQQI